MINLSRAPIVIKQKRSTNIVFDSGGGRSKIGETQNLEIDMAKQGLSDIEFLLKAITIQDTDDQIAKGNEPSAVLIDNSPTKKLRNAKKRTEVNFGTFLDRLMIRSVERHLINNIRAVVDAHTLGLGNIDNWQWMFAEHNKAGTPVNPRKLKIMPVGSMLVLKPKANAIGIHAGIQDMYAARRDAGWSERDVKGRKGTSGGLGFMAKTTYSLKRTRLMKGYTMFNIFTKKYKIPGEIYSHGTPALIIRVIKRKGGYKRYKS